jgi:Fe-S-cluster containining protein
MIVDEKAFENFKEQVLRDGPRLGDNDKFCFGCHKDLECFNHCCHDVNIFLTPYDVIRLKRCLGVSSETFLARHCVVPFSKNLKYPVVTLKMADDEAKSCPFLREPEGCSVYEHRPWSCRMYPLGRAAPPKEGVVDRAFHFMVEDEFCLGSRSDREWTVGDWLHDQGVDAYDRMGRAFQEIALHPGLQCEEALKPESMDMLFMVCYDLDRFRRFVFESSFLKTFALAEVTVDAIRSDDEALMALGFDWLRFALWREPTLKIRKDVIEAKKASMDAEKKES